MTEDFAARVAAARAASHALIDLDAYAGNVAALCTLLPARVELMAVVKANAYGHGLIPCARTAVASGATWLAVARIEEGLLLRAAGIAVPVLVLGPPNPALLAPAIAADLALSVGTFAAVEAVARAVRVAGKPAWLHIKLETGLYRYGMEAESVVALARAIAGDERLLLEGLYTHFATADEGDDRFLREQIARFTVAWEALGATGLRPPVAHLANSAASLRGAVPEIPGAARIVTRAGYALYGLAPSSHVPLPAGMRPVLTLWSRLARVFTLPAGEGVSYGRTFVAGRPTRCATLPIGYGDGLSRHLSNRGWALVRGGVCPIRGRVCMDQTVIEVAGVPEAREGDEALLIGDGRDGAMTADQVAELCGTIGYEVVTGLSARLPRLFLRGGEPVAVSDLLGLAEPGYPTP